MLHHLYVFEHGQRLNFPPNRTEPGGTFETMVRDAPAAWSTTPWPNSWRRASAACPAPISALSSVTVPIIGSDRVLGMLSMENHEREHAFGESEVRLLTTVAASMGVALENARLFEEIQRRTRESAALAEVGRDISSTLDLPTVMDRIAHHAKELLAADHSAIFLPEGTAAAAPTSYRAIVAEGEDAAQVKDLVITAGEGIIGSIIASGRAEFVNDADHDARARCRSRAPTQASDERLMVAPLRAGKTVKGAMAVWRTAGKPFQDSELEFLVGLSLAAAVAMENARLFAEAQQRAAELDTVNTVSQQLAGKLDLSALIELVGEQIRGTVQARHRLRGAARPRHRHDPLPLPARRRQRIEAARRRADQQDHRHRPGADSQLRHRPAGRSAGHAAHRQGGAAPISACRSPWTAAARA